MESSAERFGRNLRARRLALGMTQEDLARAAEVNRATVSQIENGSWNPTFGIAEKLADIVQKPMHDLLRQ